MRSTYSIATLVRHLGTAGSVKYTGTGVWASPKQKERRCRVAELYAGAHGCACGCRKKSGPERHRFPSHTSAAPPCSMHLPSPVAAPVFRPAAKALAVAVARHVARGMGHGRDLSCRIFAAARWILSRPGTPMPPCHALRYGARLKHGLPHPSKPSPLRSLSHLHWIPDRSCRACMFLSQRVYRRGASLASGNLSVWQPVSINLVYTNPNHDHASSTNTTGLLLNQHVLALPI
jgi:hypothetical protein